MGGGQIDEASVALVTGQVLIAVLLVDVTRVDVQVVEAVEVLLVAEPAHLRLAHHPHRRLTVAAIQDHAGHEMAVERQAKRIREYSVHVIFEMVHDHDIARCRGKVLLP